MGGEEKNQFNFVFVNEGSIFLALSENFENANFLKTFVLIKIFKAMESGSTTGSFRV